MKNFLNFFIKVYKLKETTRTGWGIWRIKNPETIAEHTFRVCFLAFLLGRKKGLNLKKVVQCSLVHDLCEVYAGDITPLFYYQKLDIKKKRDKKILLKGIRLPEKEKKRRSKIKFEKEKKSLLKLVSFFEKNLKKEIFFRWIDYEKGLSREGRFVKQIDWIENLIQSLEYLGPEQSGSGWWEIAQEKVYDPLLLDFLAIIQKKFYKKKIRAQKKNEDLENILDFILVIGRLKRMPRLYWILRGVKNPETVASHIFTLALMAWIFGRETKLNQEKLLKMALCHEISAVYTGDTTPYDKILPKDVQKRKEILKKMVRLSRMEKKEIFFKDYQEEEETLEKLTTKLNPALRNEIIQLWKEYRTKSSPEGYFLSQFNVLAVLLQSLLYEKKDKNFFTIPLWEWAFENIDHSLALEFLRELKKKFYAKPFYRNFGMGIRRLGRNFLSRRFTSKR